MNVTDFALVQIVASPAADGEEADIRTLGAVVQVSLSKRNLLALLSKVDDDESARTIHKSVLMPAGLPIELYVVAQPDAAHYGDKPAGEMNPEAEAYIAEHGGRAPGVVAEK